MDKYYRLDTLTSQAYSSRFNGNTFKTVNTAIKLASDMIHSGNVSTEDLNIVNAVLYNIAEGRNTLESIVIDDELDIEDYSKPEEEANH